MTKEERCLDTIVRLCHHIAHRAGHSKLQLIIHYDRHGRVLVYREISGQAPGQRDDFNLSYLSVGKKSMRHVPYFPSRGQIIRTLKAFGFYVDPRADEYSELHDNDYTFQKIDFDHVDVGEIRRDSKI